eukprot:TRINITY_DN782_c0_g1_i1.p1 TRINITY_DN782_c0_g1~~TRINITY_DN782_c0_g1_i1.p1  ORF type:complete len:552 (+),score=152.86 TRINITY_DN782_c0_g1_i1:228-1658(+)
MDIFEASGAVISAEEKKALAELDEDTMIQGLVARMPDAMKKTIEHFLLQLQLVLSTATRVRNALEEGSADEVAKIMEDGDTGITQQVLKEVVTEAGREVGEVQDVHHSWDASMLVRVARLRRCAEEAEQSAIELEKTNQNIEVFGGGQNDKTVKVLEKMFAKQEKTWFAMMWGAWAAYVAKMRSERVLQEKLQAEVDGVESKLLECKTAQLSNLRSVLNRQYEETQESTVFEVLQAWRHYVQHEKEEREVSEQLNAAQGKLSAVKASQKENARQAMLRMSDGVDEAAVAMCFGEWVNCVAEQKQEKQLTMTLKAADEQIKKCMEQKASDARAVLERMTGATDSGLLHMTFSAWVDEWKTEKRGREMEEMVASQEEKFKTLNARQKGAAGGTAKRATQMQDHMVMMQVFMNWHTEVKAAHVHRHYMGKMDHKEQKFEAVQSMIKSFASQLEQGIGGSPRGSKSRGHASDSSSRPPPA